MFDYLRNFPIAADLLPQRLRELLSPVGVQPDLTVDVCSSFERDRGDDDYEALHMVMALVADADDRPPAHLYLDDGVVAHSVPSVREKGSEAGFSPNIDNHEYIVAAWGDGSFYSYNLAEKVWMALGLVPRSIGNEIQKLVYDDLSVPTTHVAEGEISSRYFWRQSRDIRWTMSNEYLRRYLWLRGAQGARVFFYEATLADNPALRDLMTADNRFDLDDEGHWCSVSLLEIDGKIRLQVWATVVAVSCELLPEISALGLQWPGAEPPMTAENLRQLDDRTEVYLDDKFLEKYEQDEVYDYVPTKVYNHHWVSSPSYYGKWSYTNCRRYGRNLIRVSLRDLYRGIPPKETLHAHEYAMDPAVVAQVDANKEHIIKKTERVAAELLDLADNLCALGRVVGIDLAPFDLIKLSRADIEENGWKNAPSLVNLARVASLDMGKQQFLSRCKALHELWQVIPAGDLKRLIIAAGVPAGAIENFRSLKLLQILQNVLERLDRDQEDAHAFPRENEPEGWAEKNRSLAPLFVLNDLRVAEAHTLDRNDLPKLEALGFDRAALRAGYGTALDFVFDSAIESFSRLNALLAALLHR